MSWNRLSVSLISSLLVGVLLGRHPALSFLIHTIAKSTTAPSHFPLFCICIDCQWVTDCAAYHFVESKHEQPHMTDSPTFEPRNGSPTIHVNIRTIRNSADRQAQVERMWKEHSQETEKAMAKGVNHGEIKYDLSPQVTYEYDVVACEDFTLDKGCWVRNMPEEIRAANPDFVPS
jgi:hypothetical protein